MRAARNPRIMADVTCAIFSKPAARICRALLFDDTFLAENRVTDFKRYHLDPTRKTRDFFFYSVGQGERYRARISFAPSPELDMRDEKHPALNKMLLQFGMGSRRFAYWE